MSAVKQFLLSFIICLIGFGLLSYLITDTVNKRFFTEPESDTVVSDKENEEPDFSSTVELDDTDGFTALIIGTDKNGSDIDALILCRIDKGQKKLSVCSIPTDTRYTVSGTDKDGNTYSGSLSFKETARLYGTDHLLKKLYALTDQKIDYYARISLSAAQTLLGELGGTGGILYTVPEAMDYDEDDGTGIHLREGAQYLSGKKAVELLRYRTYQSGTSDIKRCTTQVDFLRKVIAEALSLDNPLYTKLLSEKERERLLGTVTTNVTADDVLKHLDLIFTLKDYEFISLPFRFGGKISTENVAALHDTFNEPFE